MAKRLNRNIKSKLKDLHEHHTNSKYFKKVNTLSPQDHWLNESEAEEAFAMRDVKDYIKFMNVEMLMVNLFVQINKIAPLRYFDLEAYLLDEFENEGELIKTVVNGLREYKRFILYHSEMELVFFSVYDQDVAVYFLDDIDNAVFKNSVSENKLYLI